MRLVLRFVAPLLLVLLVIACAVQPLVDRLTVRWFMRDLQMRSQVIALSLRDELMRSPQGDSVARIRRLFRDLAQDERLRALGYCPAFSVHPIATDAYPTILACDQLAVRVPAGHALIGDVPGQWHVTVIPLHDEQQVERGRLVLVHDMGFVERRSADARRFFVWFSLLVGLLLSIVTAIVAQMSWRSWIQELRALLQAERRPEEAAPKATTPIAYPLARDLRALVEEVHNAYRPRDDDQINWNPDALRGILREALQGEEILVVSNREPYIHIREGGDIEVQRPASGLVTALEPIMRACSGTWIAHGSGSADRETVDAADRVAVPPEHPAYRLRRIWISPEEAAGYYEGFANEGLWPLCHVAHVRPTFRSSDWRDYVEINRRFAEAVCIESSAPNPVVLVQDYHFALLPRMLRERLPEATVITFWHIPWPNPEAFAICPWQAEILDGLLGSSILGFHTRFHCNNFLDSVDRTLEARVDRELSTVHFRGGETAIKRYPISIEWPPDALSDVAPAADCRAAVWRRHGFTEDRVLAVGVDRMDYTKGILERFQAVERLLELHPEWIGRFSLVQIAAPTRTNIEDYQSFERRLKRLAERINSRFACRDYAPIILRIRHHEPPAVFEYYRAANLCLVTSLHDGMNLVAKEFIAAREDELGVLVLSCFTGAARELPEALVVNPYDIDQCAAALHAALTMPAAEQRQRMHLMRGLIREFNVYRWAGRMLIDAASMRQRGRIRGGLDSASPTFFTGTR